MGTLDGIRVIELAGLAPSPFAATMLADMGAEVLRIDRPSTELTAPAPLGRGRRSIALDLKASGAAEVVLRLVERADVLLESNRPGVAERLGIGPTECHAVNPGLVYGRMTGWGQDGPLASTVGHDINYIAPSGVLHMVGRSGERPVPPVNLVGDFGGGGMLLALGVVAALLERVRSGRGQVVDTAMTDGAALLAAGQYGMLADGAWLDERGVNLTDGGAPFYDTYETADGGYVAVGAIEARFYAALLAGLGVDAADLPDQHDRAGWPTIRARVAAVFATRDRDDWVEAFAGTEACVSPVLSLTEAPHHPHARARGAFVQVDGVAQPAPAPRFSRTPSEIGSGAPLPGADPVGALRDWGFAEAEVRALRESGTVLADAPART